MIRPLAGWSLMSLCAWTVSIQCGASPDEPPAPPKYALVLANGHYSVEPLQNPLSDAALVAHALEKTGFQVEVHSDLNRSDFYEAINVFTARLPPGSVSLIYFAGHGMQIHGINYLIPVDMVPTSETGVASRAFALSVILDKVQAAKSVVNIVVLDACRNDPFKPASPLALRGYADLGLARVVSPKGTVIAYSTAPGQLADDGKGGANSPYSSTLAFELQRPGLTVEQVLKGVGDSVRRKTLDDQQPWFESSLVDDFYFVPPTGVQVSLVPKSAALGTQTAEATRGMGQDDNTWYSQMTAGEWSQFDAHVDQRLQDVTTDDFIAIERRARTGEAVAETKLGRLYSTGADLTAPVANIHAIPGSQPQLKKIMRIEPDRSKALYWLSQAAEAGFPPAQAALGELYSQRGIVDRNDAAARDWMTKAAASDYPRAHLDLNNLAALDYKQGTQFRDEDWSGLQEGKTTTAQALESFGPPQQTIPDGANIIYVYRYSVITATPGQPNYSQSVSLVFSPDGILVSKSRHSSNTADSNPLTN